MSANLFYRIAITLAGLEKGANFFLLGLPKPDQVSFNDHAVRRPQGGGGEGRHGHSNIRLLWLRFLAEQANVLRTLIEAAEVTGGQGNGTIYLTLPKTIATSAGVAWVDISGIAIMPPWETLASTDGLVYENVILRLNDVTVEAEPSTVQS